MFIQDRNFGCEFEFSTIYHDFLPIVKPIIKEIYGEGCLKYSEKWYESTNNFNQWHLKIDNSTESELCTPVSKLKDIDNITSVLEKTGENKNIKITKNDSFHVHVDVKDIEREAILVLWMRYEKVIFSLFPSHRRNHNRYCEKSIHKEKTNKNISEYLQEAIENTKDHHSAISFYFYKHKEINALSSKRNTVEFRLGEGTTNSVFIKNWVIFLLFFIDSCKNLEIKDVVDIMCDKRFDNSDDSFNIMMKEIQIRDKELKKWILSRRKEMSNISK